MSRKILNLIAAKRCGSWTKRLTNLRFEMEGRTQGRCTILQLRAQMKKLFVFLVYLGFLAGAPSAAKAFTGGICPSGQDCWYVSYVCDSCSSDLRCQTPDIGVNPRYIQGITSGNNCAQNDYCYNDKNDHDKLVCNLNHEATNGGLCSPTCKGGGATPTPTPTPAPTPSPQPSPTATGGHSDSYSYAYTGGQWRRRRICLIRGRKGQLIYLLTLRIAQ